MLDEILVKADIGVFGGSGFYSFGDDCQSVWIETPYGTPSDKVSLATIAGKTVAFLPRHGADHRYSPSTVPYRANLWAMKRLGVKSIIAPAAVGSLRPEMHPGSFVVCDQFVDRTTGRVGTFFDGPIVRHISGAEPYCESLRRLIYQTGCEQGLEMFPKGTMVVVQGPRFSTRAESNWFKSMGWDVVNMTGYPEATLARELNICYANVSLVTDYDAGVEGHEEAVSTEEVMRVFAENTEKLKGLVRSVITRIDLEADCSCHHAVTE